MGKYMYGLILAVVLSSPIATAAEKAEVTVDGEPCRIKTIYYDETNNYIHAIGGCQFLYDKCTDDFCTARKLHQKDMYFGLKENIGKSR